jgi:uncharacterized protein YjbI with pentapeptide repeats
VACIWKACIYGANLRDADLRDAHLKGADLTGVNLNNANLNNAHLSCIILSSANVADADFDFDPDSPLQHLAFILSGTFSSSNLGINRLDWLSCEAS